MKLYHGSTKIVKEPKFGQGYAYNDYGRGFYLTEDSELACEWACKTGEDGFLCEYEIDEKKMKILDLRDVGVLTWVAVLMENRIVDLRSEVLRQGQEYVIRNFGKSINGFDMIIGYRADDSYFTAVRDFLQGTTSLGNLQSALELGDMGVQITIKTRRAFNSISFVGFQQVHSNEFFARYRRRDDVARQKYVKLRSVRPTRDDIFITDILREEMGPDDSRLQRYLSR